MKRNLSVRAAGVLGVFAVSALLVGGGALASPGGRFDLFTPEQRERARREFGVLVRIDVDGLEAVDSEVGKRHATMAFVETGDMRRTKQLRALMKSWMDEDAASME